MHMSLECLVWEFPLVLHAQSAELLADHLDFKNTVGGSDDFDPFVPGKQT